MNKKVNGIVTVSIVAVLYAFLTYFSAFLGLAYGAVQFRLSEGLMILAAHNPYMIAGLTLGCLLGNLTSTLGPIDILVGTAATFLSAVCIYFICKRIKKAVLRTVITTLVTALFNAVLIGLEISLILNEGFLITVVSVAVGEIAVCGVLSYPLEKTVIKIPLLKNFFMKRS